MIFKFAAKNISGILTAAIGLCLFSNVALAQDTIIFSDVNEGNNYYIPIYYLTNLGVISGYPDGTFKPKNNINRAEALKILTKAIAFQSFADSPELPLNSTSIIKDEPTFDSTSCPFPDLDPQSWYFGHVCEAFQNKIISGYPDGTFKPEQTINRVEAIKIGILQSGINYSIPEYQTTIYNDTPYDQWFSASASFAKSTSIFPEDSQNNLYPDELMNRGQFAALVYRFIKFRETMSEFGRASYYGPGLEGNGTASGEPFDALLMAAAHKTLAFGTRVKVTNLSNGKNVVVYINDRGPFIHGAVIDLTTAAFEQISTLSAGVANIEMEIINSPTVN